MAKSHVTVERLAILGLLAKEYRDKVDDQVVKLKKEAALKWCHYANASAEEGDKPWVYLLIPDTAINSSLDLTAAMRDYGCREEDSRF